MTCHAQYASDILGKSTVELKKDYCLVGAVVVVCLSWKEMDRGPARDLTINLRWRRKKTDEEIEKMPRKEMLREKARKEMLHRLVRS